MKNLFTFPSPDGNKNRFIVFVVESNSELTTEDKEKLNWILNPGVDLEIKAISTVPNGNIKYVGPNLRFETPESEKLRAICKSFGSDSFLRIEQFTAHVYDSGEAIMYDKMTQAVYSRIPTSLIVSHTPEPTRMIPLLTGGLELFSKVNTEMGLGMDAFDMQYYFDLFTKYHRDPTDVELLQLAQANSSHSRHWEFGGKFIVDGKEMPSTLFEMVKETLVRNPDGSIKAFKDNGGILEGGMINWYIPDSNGIYTMRAVKMNLTATAETHNHPSLISPYPGAATGIGGRMRDISAIGRGSLIGFGGLYFQTGKLWLGQDVLWNYSNNMASPIEILTGAIKGASGWGNPFGEPTLLFANDSLGIILPNGKRFESVKPIIYTCAVGSIPAEAKDKSEAEPGMVIVRIGGATRRIGIGGGAASSMNAGDNNVELDFASVQRGEPMMGRSAYNVIEHCVFMGEENPIEAIHDQGAGGASNVLTELTNPCGGIIELSKMQIADTSLSQAEAWIAESQEIYGLLVKPENLERFKSICEMYECPIEILGMTNDSERIVVKDARDGSAPVDLTLPEILGKLPQKTYEDKTVRYDFLPFKAPQVSMEEDLKNVAKVPGVTLLGYMVDHFDGSVGGRVVQGPRDGEYQLPICNYGIISNDFSGTTGTIGNFTRTNPVGMVINEQATARMMVAQSVLSLSMVAIPGGIERIKGRLNVMWPFKQPGMKAKLYSAYTAVTDALKEVGFGMDGGKDSLSMQVSFLAEQATSFPTFVLQGYAHLSDFRKRITPALKDGHGITDLILIELEECKHRMGGSALAEAYDQTGDIVPDADMSKVAKLFSLMQILVEKDKVLAGSVKLKGGLLSTVAKMSAASQVEAHVTNPKQHGSQPFYFNEEIGIVLQCSRLDAEKILEMAEVLGLHAKRVGWAKSSSQYFSFYGTDRRYSPHARDVRAWFSETSKQIKQIMGIPSELLNVEQYSRQSYKLTFNPDEKAKEPDTKSFRVAVLSAPGTNGHHELAHMFSAVPGQFEVQTVQMKQLASGERDLKDFHVIAFAGGFSYGDVGGSGKGWAASILFNSRLKKMFDDFFTRPDTLSFGVCNGFQVATLLGLLDESLGDKPRLIHNDSGMFEHRPVNLLIPENSVSIMFNGMQGSILPAWSAHGEGKVQLSTWYPNYDDSWLKYSGLVCVQYADKSGKETTEYPYNPNGSDYGIAGLCTKDGRHTFMMPHIERVSASNEHLPYKPKDWNFKTPVWQRSIQNMYEWLCENA